MALIAFKQRRAEIVLQLLDLLAQRGLRHVQLDRGAGEVEFFGDHDRVAQQAQLDAMRNAGLAGKAYNEVENFRIMGDYYYKNTYGFTMAYNGTWGTSDKTLYSPASVVGSANGSPNTQSLIWEADWVPFGKSADTVWDFEKNLKIGLQYTDYLEFNGGTNNFDGFGHNASGMNTLYLYLWMAF